MQCRIIGSALDTALRFLAAATVGARTTMPILSHILLNAREGQLTMAATNLTMWLQWVVDAEVIKPGKVAVPSKEWRTLVASLLNEQVQLEVQGESDMTGRMTVRFGEAEYRLPILPAEEFPEPSEAVWEEAVEVDGTRLSQAVKKVLFAASTDLTMGVYAGVHFRKEREDAPLDIVATDTHRMALVSLEDTAFPPFQVTLPASALKVLVPLWEKAGTVRCQGSEGKQLIAWEGGQWKATVTALTGSFPNYKRVIPTEWAHEIVFKTSAMLSALRRMSIFRPSSKRTPQRVLLRLKDNEMEMVAIEAEYGSYEEVGREVIKIEWQSKPTVYEIAFQHPYLAEFLSIVKEGEVIVRFQEDNTSASVWQPKGDETFSYIVMPMHLPGSEGF